MNSIFFTMITGRHMPYVMVPDYLSFTVNHSFRDTAAFIVYTTGEIRTADQRCMRDSSDHGNSLALVSPCTITAVLWTRLPSHSKSVT